ncbi:Solute carrier organic anion transporter family member [Aphelenchoides fujianensis]|nr:Solute carrier organic anion transporter family member [Aphelenchoides fujianensis]
MGDGGRDRDESPADRWNGADGGEFAYPKGASSIQSVYDDSEEDRPLLCGCWSCTPAWLQKFHNAKWLLFMLGICAFIQSFVVNSIFPVGLSTIERRFHMTSTHTGIISSWYDFAVLLAVFPVCHWGNNGHKGRWIGLGTFVMGIGSFICALPHYLVSPHDLGQAVNSTDFGQCLITDVESQKCTAASDQTASYLNPYFLIFLLGQTFHGRGRNAAVFDWNGLLGRERFAEGVARLFGNPRGGHFRRARSSACSWAAFLLTIYDDFDRVDMSKLDITTADPRWIGAWWLGFLGCAVAAFLNAFPILMFARELPEAKRHRQKDVNQMHVASKGNENVDTSKGSLKTIPRSVANILRNPTFVTTIVLGIFESIIINGFAAFMPKILETILSTTPTIASYLSSIVIFAAAAGVMIGGVVIRQMNLQVAGMLKMILVCHVIALILILSFFIQCPSREFVGITTGYGQEKLKNGVSNMYSTCNSDCHCKAEWSPVCDPVTNQIYYSPCFAGCSARERTATGDVWTGCKCLNSTYFDEDNGAMDRIKWDSQLSMKGGFCTKDCGWPMWVFLTLLFFSVVASFASGIPLNRWIMLRVVPFQQRTLGISVHWTFLRLLGFIPGGVLFGLMIDTSCVKWQESTCGKKQSCLVYDQSRLSWTIMVVAVVCKLVSILATIVGYMTYKPTDVDSSASIQTTDSRGPLSLTVNDDRPKVEPNSNDVKSKRSSKKKKILNWNNT